MRNYWEAPIYRLSSVPLERIEKIICEYFRIESKDLKGKNRNRLYVTARKIFFHFANKLNHSTTTLHGKYLGLGHPTCIHHRKSAKNLLETDKDFQLDVFNIKNKLQ